MREFAVNAVAVVCLGRKGVVLCAFPVLLYRFDAPKPKIYITTIAARTALFRGIWHIPLVVQFSSWKNVHILAMLRISTLGDVSK